MTMDYGGRSGIETFFNVLEYGAKADNGVTDNGPAFQAAATDAIALGGTLVIPVPALSKYYGIATTVNLAPAGGANSFTMDILATGGTSANSPIKWTGANNSSVFSAFGWKRSTVSNVIVGLPSPLSGITVWNLDVNATQTSTGIMSFIGCVVSIGSGATSNIAWRLGHTGGAIVSPQTEMSFINWFGCNVSAGANTDNNLAWLDEHQNGLNHSWYGCSATKVLNFYTNAASAGGQNGNNSKYFYGCGGSTNNTDFKFAVAGPYLISGGRFEVGTQLVLANWGTSSGTITLDTVTIANYAGDGAGAVIRANAAASSIILRNVQASAHNYTANFVTLNGSGLLKLEGCYIQTTSDPPYTVSVGSWETWVNGSSQIDSFLIPTTAFVGRAGTLGRLTLSGAAATDSASGALTLFSSVTPTSGVRPVGLWIAGTLNASADSSFSDQLRLDNTTFANGAFLTPNARGLVISASGWLSTGTAPTLASAIALTLPSIGSSANTGLAIGTPAAGTWAIYSAGTQASSFGGSITASSFIANGSINGSSSSGAINSIGNVSANGGTRAIGNYIAGTLTATVNNTFSDFLRIADGVAANGVTTVPTLRGVAIDGSSWTNTGTAPTTAIGVRILMPTLATNNVGVSLGNPAAGSWGYYQAGSDANSFGGSLTLAADPGLKLSTAASRIVPGATSISLRNNANSADNLIITDAGVATFRGGFAIDAAGHLISTSAGTPTTTSLGTNVTSVTFTGNDVRGTIAVVMSGALAANTRISTNTFATSYGATAPKVTLVNQTSGVGLTIVNFYVSATSTGVSFDLASDQALAAGTYTIDYIVIG